MSAYGVLWAQIYEVRRAIRGFAPGMSTNSVAEARTAFAAGGADIRRHEKEIAALLGEWDRLEAEIARCWPYDRP